MYLFKEKTVSLEAFTIFFNKQQNTCKIFASKYRYEKNIETIVLMIIRKKTQFVRELLQRQNHSLNSFFTFS